MGGIEIGCIVVTCILLIIVLCLAIRFKRAKAQQFEQWKVGYQSTLEQQYKDKLKEIQDAETKSKNLEKKNQDLDKTRDMKASELSNLMLDLKSIQKEIDSKKEFNDRLRKMREEELDRLIEEEKAHKMELVDLEVQDWAASAQEAARNNYNELVNDQEKDIELKQEQVKYLITQLAEQQSKIEAVNKEILRRRAIEEKNEFYSIQISEAVKNDIEILNEIRPKLSSLEIFNKFIYDNYIGKPTKEMVQRVLSGKNPSGIYKVTNIDTHEAYIGKSVKIADRWQNHVKAAAGLGGVAESQFQRALKKYGVDKFTWEVIEEVDKDELTAREKYWITFYRTKEYGYNQREG